MEKIAQGMERLKNVFQFYIIIATKQTELHFQSHFGFISQIFPTRDSKVNIGVQNPPCNSVSESCLLLFGFHT